MNNISAVIITKNEQQNIRRCLNSLVDVVDEIIVVDSYSTDDTEKICNDFDVEFIKKEFEDYSCSKNYGNSMAKHSFILSLDADEAISEELKESLVLVKSYLKHDGYSFNRRTNYCGQWIYHCGWYPDHKLRLFRKSKAKWEGKIHEILRFSSDKKAHLKGDLLHYSYPNLSSHAEKMDLFTEMAARDLFEKKKKVSTLKLIVAPMFEFFKKYILYRGFLDGYYGFIISIMSSYYKFFKYSKLKNLWIKHNAPINNK
jgi:glycosyltransferase involved in cell wall biosynthesis